MLQHDVNLIDFKAQADQMMLLIEAKLAAHEKVIALEYMILKFKTLFEQGVASGRLYEREGVYPYSLSKETAF